MLFYHDLKQELPVETWAANKVGDDGENCYSFEVHGLHSAI
jgi:hypothetical protein